MRVLPSMFWLIALFLSVPAAAKTGCPLGATGHNEVMNGVNLWYQVAGGNVTRQAQPPRSWARV